MKNRSEGIRHEDSFVKEQRAVPVPTERAESERTREDLLQDLQETEGVMVQEALEEARLFPHHLTRRLRDVALAFMLSTAACRSTDTMALPYEEAPPAAQASAEKVEEKRSNAFIALAGKEDREITVEFDFLIYRADFQRIEVRQGDTVLRSREQEWFTGIDDISPDRPYWHREALGTEDLPKGRHEITIVIIDTKGKEHPLATDITIDGTEGKREDISYAVDAVAEAAPEEIESLLRAVKQYNTFLDDAHRVNQLTVDGGESAHTATWSIRSIHLSQRALERARESAQQRPERSVDFFLSMVVAHEMGHIVHDQESEKVRISPMTQHFFTRSPMTQHFVEGEGAGVLHAFNESNFGSIRGGHAQDDPDELYASAFSAKHHHPEDFDAIVRAMTPEQQRIITQIIAVIK